MNTITIQETDNGYIITNKYTVEDGKEEIGSYRVVEDYDDDEQDTIARLLYEIAVCLGVEYNKWSKGNLSISWDKKGYKLE